MSERVRLIGREQQRRKVGAEPLELLAPQPQLRGTPNDILIDPIQKLSSIVGSFEDYYRDKNEINPAIIEVRTELKQFATEVMTAERTIEEALARRDAAEETCRETVQMFNANIQQTRQYFNEDTSPQRTETGNSVAFVASMIPLAATFVYFLFKRRYL